MKETTTTSSKDIESNGKGTDLTNEHVQSLSWKGVEVELRHGFSSDLQPRRIVSDLDGIATAGKLS